MGGLNKEIQTILEYKDYTTITRLFHLACKAEREVQDRQAATRPNFSAGRNTSWTSRGPSTYTRPAAPPSTTTAHSYRQPPKQPPPRSRVHRVVQRRVLLHPWHPQGKHEIVILNVAGAKAGVTSQKTVPPSV